MRYSFLLLTLEAISKLSFGLQKHLLALNFVAKTLHSYGYVLILEKGPLTPLYNMRLVQNQNLAFSPSKTFLRCLLVTCIMSCQKGFDKQEVTVHNIDEAQLTLLTLQDNDEFLYYDKIEVFDSLLIGVRWGQDDYRLDVVSLPTQKVIRTFGQAGGPNRMFRIELTGQFFYRENSIWCALFSPQRGLFLLDVLSKQPLSESMEIVQDKFDLPVMGYYLDTAQQKVLGTYMDESASFFFDLASTDYEVYDIPSIPSSFTRQGIEAANALGHTSAWNNDLNQFAVAYFFYNRIDVFDRRGQFSHSISFGRDDNPVNIRLEGDAPAGRNTFYFGLLDFADNHLVATYFDRPYSEIYNQQEQDIIIHDITTGKQRFLRIPFLVHSICFSPDKQQIFLAVDDDRRKSNVYILDLESLNHTEG